MRVGEISSSSVFRFFHGGGLIALHKELFGHPNKDYILMKEAMILGYVRECTELHKPIKLPTTFFGQSWKHRLLLALIDHFLHDDQRILLIIARCNGSQQEKWIHLLFARHCFLRRCRLQNYITLGRWAIENGCKLLPEWTRNKRRYYSSKYLDIFICYHASDLSANILDWVLWYQENHEQC